MHSRFVKHQGKLAISDVDSFVEGGDTPMYIVQVIQENYMHQAVSTYTVHMCTWIFRTLNLALTKTVQ